MTEQKKQLQEQAWIAEYNLKRVNQALKRWRDQKSRKSKITCPVCGRVTLHVQRRDLDIVGNCEKCAAAGKIPARQYTPEQYKLYRELKIAEESLQFMQDQYLTLRESIHHQEERVRQLRNCLEKGKTP